MAVLFKALKRFQIDPTPFVDTLVQSFLSTHLHTPLTKSHTLTTLAYFHQFGIYDPRAWDILQNQLQLFLPEVKPIELLSVFFTFCSVYEKSRYSQPTGSFYGTLNVLFDALGGRFSELLID